MMYSMIGLKVGRVHWTHPQWPLAMPSGKHRPRENLKAAALKSWWEQDNGDEVRSINKKMQLSLCQGPGITKRKTISGGSCSTYIQKKQCNLTFKEQPQWERKITRWQEPKASANSSSWKLRKEILQCWNKEKELLMQQSNLFFKGV